MTADTKLLTMPEPMRVLGTRGKDAAEAWCRANVAHATAAKDAEIERLRVEVERLKTMTAMTMGVGCGGGSLFVHGDYESIKAAQDIVLRAERLAEALIAWHKQATDKGRREREESPGHSHNVLGVWDDDNGKYAGVECAQCALWFEASRLRAALDQEVGNG